VGPPGGKVQLDVGKAAAPAMPDWDEDGRRDLIVGGNDGRVRYLRNEGTATAPDFQVVELVQNNGTDLIVGSGRATPVIADLDGDGKKDLLTGYSTGGVRFYPNVGTNSAPTFAGFVSVLTNGVPVSLSSPGRSKPSLCDWTGDGSPDLLIGGGDRKVHLFQGVGYITSFCFGDGTGASCPCDNPGFAGQGCANSSGQGALLTATGSPSILAADLTLFAYGAIPGQAGLFFQGNNAVGGGDGLAFGDGLRCAGGAVTRLEVVIANILGDIATTIDITAKGGVASGDLRRYQLWYRDPVGGPCGSEFNLSNGVEVLWIP